MAGMLVHIPEGLQDISDSENPVFPFHGVSVWGVLCRPDLFLREPEVNAWVVYKNRSTFVPGTRAGDECCRNCVSKK